VLNLRKGNAAGGRYQIDGLNKAGSATRARSMAQLIIDAEGNA